MNKAAIILAMVLWGIVQILNKDVLQYIGPNVLAFGKTLAAFLFMLPFIVYKRIPLRRMLNRRFVLYGLIGCGGYYIIQTQGVSQCSAGISTLLQSTATAFGLLLGKMILQEKLTPLKVCGGVISVAGVALASYEALMEGGETTLIGVCLMILSQFMWATYTVWVKKWDEKTDSMLVTTSMFLYGSLIIVPFALEEIFVSGAMPAISAEVFGKMILNGVLCTGAPMLLWNFGVKKVESGIASIAINFIPVVGIASLALMGDPVGRLQYIGCAVILIGVFLTNERKQRLGALSE